MLASPRLAAIAAVVLPHFPLLYDSLPVLRERTREGSGDGAAYYRPGVVLDGRVSLSAGSISGRRFDMLGDGSLLVLEASGTYEDAADGFFYSEHWTAAVDDAREGELVMLDVAQVLELALRRAGAPAQAQAQARAVRLT
jgi:hypothetical protein